MPTVEKENARAEFERGWREGAEAMWDLYWNTLRRYLVEFPYPPLPEPPKEEEPKRDA